MFQDLVNQSPLGFLFAFVCFSALIGIGSYFLFQYIKKLFVLSKIKKERLNRDRSH